MSYKFESILPAVAAMGLACLAIGSLAADTRPPAGQMCPGGAYVIGFDSASNIVCSTVAGTAAAKAQETGDACPEGCAKVTEETRPAGSGQAAPGLSTDDLATGGPVISAVKPRWVVFGARETTIRIIGSGFTSDTIVKFQGNAYSASVNAAGTELSVTIPTRDLPMGRYALTVSNGDGREITRPRALEVF